MTQFPLVPKLHLRKRGKEGKITTRLCVISFRECDAGTNCSGFPRVARSRRSSDAPGRPFGNAPNLTISGQVEYLDGLKSHPIASSTGL